MNWRRAALLIAGVVVLGMLLLVTGRGRTPGLPGTHAIAVLEEIELGGDPQWILVRGRDARAPVLLFLHGGPGMPAMYLAHDFQRPLEEDFVVVHWDRLGAGKSYEAGLDDDRFTLRRTLDDTHQLAEHLGRRFGRKRIYLLGHSWGSYLGMVAAAERPELYAAFIGTGQMAGSDGEVSAWRRGWALREARRANEESIIAKLENGAVVTEDMIFRLGGELFRRTSYWPILLTGLAAPEYTLRDVVNVKKGVDRVNPAMTGDELPLNERVPHLPLPTFFLLGRYDANTPAPLAEAYLERLQAPLKRIVWFRHSAHFPFWEQPARFHEAMLEVEAATEAFWKRRDNDQPGSTTTASPGDGKAAR